MVTYSYTPLVSILVSIGLYFWKYPPPKPPQKKVQKQKQKRSSGLRARLSKAGVLVIHFVNENNSWSWGLARLEKLKLEKWCWWGWFWSGSILFPLLFPQCRFFGVGGLFAFVLSSFWPWWCWRAWRVRWRGCGTCTCVGKESRPGEVLEEGVAKMWCYK